MRTKASNVPIILVGNKSDDPEIKRAVSKAYVAAMIENWDCTAIECNVKADRNIFDIFAEVLIALNFHYDLAKAAVDRFRRSSRMNAGNTRFNRRQSIDCPIL